MDLEVLAVHVVATQLRVQDRADGVVVLCKRSVMYPICLGRGLDSFQLLPFGLRGTNFDYRTFLFVRSEHLLGFLRRRGHLLWRHLRVFTLAATLKAQRRDLGVVLDSVLLHASIGH